MNQEDALSLAARIADDLVRAGLTSVVMVATVDDETGDTYLDLFDSTGARQLGRLYSHEGYDRILERYAHGRRTARVSGDEVSLN